MLSISRSRKADRDLYNSKAEEYIPIACHFNENTLLTKNGELLQVIQINGISSEKISDKLFNLREMVRSAIKSNVKSDKFAFWIHTIRRKTNLDDIAPYDKLLPANIHDLWRRKNYWDDKFVNTLYISIIYDSAQIKIKNANSFINSLDFKVIQNFHSQYLDHAFHQLNTAVDKILADLNDYGAEKLGIWFEEDKSYSEPLSLYHQIVHLTEAKCLVPITDLSDSLASNQYAVGSDKIEVIDETGKRFAAILSIKEYQEISSEALDNFLQLPLELIATEIFYFIDKKQVTPIFSEQDYILKVSGDANLKIAKGLDKILDGNDLAETNKFCRQQISITIIGNNLEKLDKQIINASQELSEIGIVHVREDINLEQTFWAQLPGNFSFLRRMSPTVIDNTAALASLHNFPTGSQYTRWGRAVTLLRTEKGTPYFMNLHTNDDKNSTCIFGIDGVGKTTLTNFIISEATKFKPTILYFATNNDSQVFIKAIEGKWLEQIKHLVNPFLCDDNETSRTFTNEFLKIICNHYIAPLTKDELNFLAELTNKIFALEEKDRQLSTILLNLDYSSAGGDLIKSKLAAFAESGLYKGIFDKETRLNFTEKGIIGINLYDLTDDCFTKQFSPQDRKLIDEFTAALNLNKSVRCAIIYVFTHYLTLSGSKPKILGMDNMDSLLDQKYFSEFTTNIFDKTRQNNGVIIGNVNLSHFLSLGSEIQQKWHEAFSCTIILPLDAKINNLSSALNLNKLQREKLEGLAILSRMFLLKHDDTSIIAELSIGGLVSLTRILSSGPDELAIYQKVIQEHPGNPENWIDPLYKALEAANVL